MNPYIGHDSQLYGIEEHRLVGGKGLDSAYLRYLTERDWSLPYLLTVPEISADYVLKELT